MPTRLPRTQVTHTVEVQQALTVAEARWPGVPTSVLMTKLMTAGANALTVSDSTAETERKKKIEAMAGKYSDNYRPGYLDELRQGWPE